MTRFIGRPTDAESYLLKRQRLRVARDIISEQGNVTDFAKAIGISVPGAIYYLRRHSPETLQVLKDGNRRIALDPGRVLHRLRVISQSKTKVAAAEKLGLSQPGVFMFIKRYAPHGIEDALQDYEEAYGAPLLEDAA
ncbi:MAG: hypothetical protein HRT63_09625 [Erythrobacter sp.]|nr:hypothetical protein [Erythrobacter sp.]